MYTQQIQKLAMTAEPASIDTVLSVSSADSKSLSTEIMVIKTPLKVSLKGEKRDNRPGDEPHDYKKLPLSGED